MRTPELTTAERDRDEAMLRVEERANPEWLAAARMALIRCATLNPTFIADEVWAYIPEGLTTHDTRALGPVIKRAQTQGYITKTEDFQPSERRHATPQRVWRSLIFLKGI